MATQNVWPALRDEEFDSDSGRRCGPRRIGWRSLRYESRTDLGELWSGFSEDRPVSKYLAKSQPQLLFLVERRQTLDLGDVEYVAVNPCKIVERFADSRQSTSEAVAGYPVGQAHERVAVCTQRSVDDIRVHVEGESRRDRTRRRWHPERHPDPQRGRWKDGGEACGDFGNDCRNPWISSMFWRPNRTPTRCGPSNVSGSATANSATSLIGKTPA